MTEEKEYTDAEEQEFNLFEKEFFAKKDAGEPVSNEDTEKYIQMFQRWRKYIGLFGIQYNLHNPSTPTNDK